MASVFWISIATTEFNLSKPLEQKSLGIWQDESLGSPKVGGAETGVVPGAGLLRFGDHLHKIVPADGGQMQ